MEQNVKFIRKNGRIIPIRRKKSGVAEDLVKGTAAGALAAVSAGSLSSGLSKMGKSRAQAASAFYAKVGPAAKLADEYSLAAASWGRSKAAHASERVSMFTAKAAFQNRLSANYKTVAKFYGKSSNALYKASGFVKANRLGIAVATGIAAFSALRLKE